VLRDLVIGADEVVPTLSGSMVRYVNLDSAATTPAMHSAMGAIQALLPYEHGIRVRSGCFCAHPYIAHLLGLDTDGAASWLARVRDGDKRNAPGMVRVSFGFYNDIADVNRLLLAVWRIVEGDVAGTFRSDRHGEYRPVGRRPDVEVPNAFVSELP